MHFLPAQIQRLFVPTAETDEGPQAIVALSGISQWLWRLYALFWLVCLWYAIFLLLHTHLTPVRVGIVVVGGILCAALYLWLIWPHPVERLVRWRARFPLALSGFTVLAVSVLLLSVLDDPAWLWVLVCVSAVAGLLFPLRGATVVVVLLTVCSFILGVLRLGWVRAIPLALLVRGLGLDMIGLILLMGALRQVQRQRQALAHLAVAEERLRVARDLHDVLGRNLSVVTLKSALAERLVTTDPGRAVEEIRAVEQLARTTLREMRAAIAGYRQMTVQGELEGARQLLEATEIHADVDTASGELPPAIDSVLGWVIREGVTNVLRHSRATRCYIVMRRTEQRVWVEMTNDGCRQETGMQTHGQGLAGLRERVEALGGQVVAGPMPLAGHPGFHLRAELPLHEHTQEEPA